MTTSDTQPLQGIHVVDFSRYAPGLLATTILARLGADVISVEPVGALSDPPLYPTSEARAQGIHPFFAGRSSIAVDLKRPAGRDIARRLIARSDVLFEGFRPGVAERLGIGYADAVALNDRIVYCSVTGYGRGNADAERPGHDVNYLAESGVLALTGAAGAAPTPPLNLLADLAGGALPAALAVLAALHARDRTGKPQRVDVSMVESLLALLAPTHAQMEASAPDPSWGNGLLNGRAPFYRSYRTSDDRWICLGALEPKFFREVCRVLGCEEFADRQYDLAAWESIGKAFETAFRGAPRDVWAQRLGHAALSPVLTVSEARDRAHPSATSDAIANPLSSVRAAAGPYAHKPGQDTSTVLAQLGCSETEIAALLTDGTVE